MIDNGCFRSDKWLNPIPTPNASKIISEPVQYATTIHKIRLQYTRLYTTRPTFNVSKFIDEPCNEH